ncbi:MAG: UDP-N-acetylglucosamine 1-carboxyvinyltransferase [Candidatus Peribacteraceae bacterium]|nr:UDP-N-acetylglucosamine 1-carboxyvinyltransferase [Candidatus Peribacteraceae bacterium]
MNLNYRVRGGVPLRGDVSVGGSKNAALPLIAGSLLVSGETVLRNVPRLTDTLALLRVLEFLGAETRFEDGILRIRTDRLRSQPIPAQYVSQLRGSIVLLGPLLARFGVVEMAYPGGCVLGKRPVLAHIEALVQMGAVDMSTDAVLHLQGTLKPGRVVLPEFSVTATENAVLAASVLPGETVIELAAAEPHVHDVETFVEEMGAEVRGKGSHTVTIRGTKEPRPVTHTVISDYLEAGALVLAALVTRGKLRISGADESHLVSFLDVLRRAGAVWRFEDAGTLVVDGEASVLKAMHVRTNIFPGFPTDLQAPLGVAMTQAQGVSRIFERLYEGRFGYLFELEKMGAHVEFLNAHQALIIGPTALRGRTVASNDIRAGTAMVLAALCAEGETVITDVRYIERGYDKLDEKLRGVGARIERIEE